MNKSSILLIKYFIVALVIVCLIIISFNLVQVKREKEWNLKSKQFEKKLHSSIIEMNLDGNLAGHKSTLDFVEKLKNYIKIKNVCKNTQIEKCFAKSILWDEKKPAIDTSQIKSSAQLGNSDWNTETVAVQFANGVNAIIAYNPNAPIGRYNSRIAPIGESISIIYDVTENGGPNIYGKDIRQINVNELNGITKCLIPELANTICITQILEPDKEYSPMTVQECKQAIKNNQFGIKKCGVQPDLWAGAARICGGTNKMPTLEQLTQLDRYFYEFPDDLSDKFEVSLVNGFNLKEKEIAPFVDKSPYSDVSFSVWSNKEDSDRFSYTHIYSVFFSYTNLSMRHYITSLAVCVAPYNK